MEFIYFIVGFFAGVFGLIGLALKIENSEKTKKPRGYVKVENLKWHFDQDMQIQEGVTGYIIGRAIAKSMDNLMEEDRPFKDWKAKPGLYTVTYDVNAKFVMREEDGQEPEKKAS